jgi:glycosyltransferase involved in cell wall biosynthesis
VAWGLPADRFLVLENGQPSHALPSGGTTGSTLSASLHTRFLVLGQLSRLKGSEVLLDAVRSLPKAVASTVRIEIHGSIQHAEERFRTRFLEGCTELAPTVQYCGPYLPQDVSSVLATAGWLIVPSIWWENSPMVIQEAFRCARPVIASNIGGMAEKVKAGETGLHFRVGSASDLARCIEEAASDPHAWKRMSESVRPPPSLESTVGTLRGLYSRSRADIHQMLAHAGAEAALV